uniref:Uncharacterized protein n=1 Tax=Alexandrium monilatum TaxID=311494 RepID=A0A7S4UMD6_9DINO|mmetsp:Transcript_714/g.2436  ORF Transcript_714/g.2436 Transcript_714/m.2436 type:complete len:179 (+) Transcript_714:76-612(+)
MQALRVLRMASLALALGAARDSCPGSPAVIHAKAQVRVRVAGSCSDAMAEMRARVNGQFGRWHDPHNNGTYTLLRRGSSQLEFSRLTGDRRYTDLLTFTFQDTGGASCLLEGCSESQVFSIRDYSTNLCNLCNLYCNRGQGCHPVLHNLPNSQVRVWTSIGAGKDEGECLKVRRLLLL